MKRLPIRPLSALLAAAMALTSAMPAAADSGSMVDVPAAGSTTSAGQRPFAYGVTIADPSTAAGGSFDLARRAGFTHVYAVLRWDEVEPDRGRYAWANGSQNSLDTLIAGSKQYGLKLIIRLDKPPVWAGGSPTNLDAGVLRTFANAVAMRAKGAAVAYEVFNEPNLPFEFGGAPNPGKYVQLLAAAHDGIKAADSSAMVISAGMAPYTGSLNGTMEDVDYLRAIYRAGGQRYFDALGIHPYGGSVSPESGSPDCGICFRRAELYRQVMVEQGDSGRQAWITEFGYLHTTGVDLGEYNWLKLSPETQGDYLVRAFQYGYQHWPWLGGSVLFNLDFSTVSWTGSRSGMYWFGLLNPDRSPRPAYQALTAMAKPGATQLPAIATTTATSPQTAPTGGAAAPPAPTGPGSTTCTTYGRTAVCTAAPSVNQPSTGTVCTTYGRTAICRPRG